MGIESNFGEYNKERRDPSLCWYCANAVPSRQTGCNWSRNFEPVDGWVADMTDKHHRNELGSSYVAQGKHAYLVRECPEFIPDTKEFHKATASHEEGLNALALDVIKYAVTDFIPRYSEFLDVSLRRGDRFVCIDNKLLKMRMPFCDAVMAEARAELKKMRQEVYKLNHERKEVDGEEKEAISIEVKALYKRMAAMRIPSDDRFHSTHADFRAIRRFFVSDYAYHLTELDPVVLMKKVMRQIEDDNDIPMMKYIIRPKKILLKGRCHGTRRNKK